MTQEFSQPELIAAILKWLERHGCRALLPRQVNAVIVAADGILAELNRPYQPAVPGMGWLAWLACDDIGSSSSYLGTVLQDCRGRAPLAYPHDPGDFGRCVRLLDAVPELRPLLPRMRTDHGPQWAALVAVWDELEALFREEAPNGLAPKLFARMTELLKGAETKP